MKTKAYTNVDQFLEDLRAAIHIISNRSISANLTEKTKQLEEEVISMLNDEIERSALPIPRSENSEPLLSGPKTEDGSLSVDANVVLSTAGFVYGSAQASKRLYSSFRLSANNSEKELEPLPLDKLPNNITATRTKIEKIGRPKSQITTLKDVFQHTKHARLEPPRLSNTSTKGLNITWSKQEFSRRAQRSKDRQSRYDQQLATGQWLCYNQPSTTSQIPFAEARRKQRDRALSTGEANIELAPEELETIHKSQQTYQQARTDSTFKSLYSSFAPNHDNSGAIISKQLKGLHWWIKEGAAKYLGDTVPTVSSPFEDQENPGDEKAVVEERAIDEDQIQSMLDSWIDPELIGGMPKERDATEREGEEILQEISEMLETLSSYQRNRSLTLVHKQQSSSAQNKSLLELLGDPSTPSDSECLLYDTLKESLTSLIQLLPPYAVAKLNGEQLGQLNISTKMLVTVPNTKGTMTDLELQDSNQSTANVSRSQPVATLRTSISQQQIPSPSLNASQSIPRPTASIYSKYRPSVGTPGYPNYGSQPTTPRITHGQQTPSSTPVPLTNGTRPTINGYNSYTSQNSPPRPSSASTPKPLAAGPSQTYSTYNTAAMNINAERSASPQVNASAFPNRSQRTNWSSSNGITSSMSSAEDASKTEERQKSQTGVQIAQMHSNSEASRIVS